MLDSESAKIVQRIDKNCKLLYEGYYEKVEYDLGVSIHRGHCRYYGKSQKPKDCDCPVSYEKRVRNVRRPGYLAQLKEFAQHKDTDRNPKAERSAPRIKSPGRPPGDMGGFFALDEIECDIPAVVDRFLADAGRDRTWAAIRVPLILQGLAGQVSEVLATDPASLATDRDRDLQDHRDLRDLAVIVDLAATRWVDLARQALRVNVSNAIFDAVVCGNCGGALSTPWGNSGESDVRCIGMPDAPPCGETYPPGEWLRLYEESRGRVISGDGRS